jgi:hypothetical protein
MLEAVGIYTQRLVLLRVARSEALGNVVLALEYLAVEVRVFDWTRTISKDCQEREVARELQIIVLAKTHLRQRIKFLPSLDCSDGKDFTPLARDAKRTFLSGG